MTRLVGRFLKARVLAADHSGCNWDRHLAMVVAATAPTESPKRIIGSDQNPEQDYSNSMLSSLVIVGTKNRS